MYYNVIILYIFVLFSSFGTSRYQSSNKLYQNYNCILASSTSAKRETHWIHFIHINLKWSQRRKLYFTRVSRMFSLIAHLIFKSKPIKKILSPSVEIFEASRIIDSAKYQFWVKAITKVGEGESTKTITVLPTIKISAQIVSFSQVLIIRWKKNVTLNCKRVGIPYPQPLWTKGGRSIISNGRYQVT